MFEEARAKLKIILNDEPEYDRLTNLFDSVQNIYGRQAEAEYLDTVSSIALTGFDTRQIKSIESLRGIYWAVCKIKA